MFLVVIAVVVGVGLLLAYLSDRRDRRHGHQPSITPSVREGRRDARALGANAVQPTMGTRWMHHSRGGDKRGDDSARR